MVEMPRLLKQTGLQRYVGEERTQNKKTTIGTDGDIQLHFLKDKNDVIEQKPRRMRQACNNKRKTLTLSYNHKRKAHHNSSCFLFLE